MEKKVEDKNDSQFEDCRDESKNEKSNYINEKLSKLTKP